MNWKRMLATISGSVDQELLLRNEYLLTENRILKNQIKGRLQLTDPERISLAEIGQRLGRKALEEVAQIVRPETILLHSIRRDPPGRRYQSGDIAAAESRSERPMRTLDSIRKGRAPVENDSFRRKLSPPLP